MNQPAFLADNAAARYRRHRPAYPKRLTDRVIALAGLAPGDAVLDLGAGPGFLALAFAQSGMNVTAADPDADMLAVADASARAADVKLDLWRGGSADLTQAMGPFRLVTMGRSFHWMDRTPTLVMLDKIVGQSGAIALFHDAHPPVPEKAWFKVMCDIAGKFGRIGSGGGGQGIGQTGGGHHRYEPYLFASAFTQLDGSSVTERRAITADDIVGRVTSLSSCGPEKLGDQSPRMEAALREGLAKLSPDGNFVEVIEFVALLARRGDV